MSKLKEHESIINKFSESLAILMKKYKILSTRKTTIQEAINSKSKERTQKYSKMSTVISNRLEATRLRDHSADFRINNGYLLKPVINQREMITKNTNLSCLEIKLDNSIKNEELNKIQKESHNLEAKLSEMKSEHAKIKKLYNDCLHKLSFAEGKAKEEVKKLLEEMRVVKENLVKVQSDNTNLRKKNKKLVEDNAKCNTDINSVKEDIKLTINKLSTVESEKTTLQQVIEDSKKRLKASSEEIKQNNVHVKELQQKLNTQVLELKEAIKEKENVQSRCNEELKSLKEQSNKLEEELNKKLSEAEKERDDYKQKYMAKIEELGQVKTKAEKLHSDFEKCNKKRTEQNLESIRKMEEDSLSLKAELQLLSTQLSTQQQLNKELQSENIALSTQCKRLCEELSIAEISKETFDSEVVERRGEGREENLATRVARLEEEKSEWKKELDASCEKLAKESLAYKERLLKFKEDYLRVYQEMKRLKKALKVAQEALSQKEAEKNCICN
eukprot:TRINITY_DN7540_c0_g1_i7.p2 TRINITY_DN7540_c0_g1~~TRINITY_DN7540_c0_g1_i7.p2  ORF type:complete len:502 (+),score=149.77 TRINITY_DN7540_c0_g1_i7:2221-3726(+)